MQSLQKNTPTSRIDWVAVTGMARSGTTFVGDTLALGRSTVYVHEPFSRNGIQGVDWNCEQLVGEDLIPATEKARQVIDDILRLRGRSGNHVPRVDPWARRCIKSLVGGRGRFAWRVARLMSPWAKRGVLKDPFAWRFCPSLSVRNGVRVVAVVKHPVSQVASYARAGWRGNIATIEPQADVLRQLDPSDFDHRVDSSCTDAVACAREWRWLYRLLGQWADRYGWTVVRIEDIAEDPQKGFAELFRALGWNAPMQLDRALAKRTQSNNPVEARQGVFQDLNRNSKMIFRMRVDSVPLPVRRQVFEETFDVASRWYDEESFSL